MSLKDYLRDDTQYSAMRLFGFLCVLAAFLFTLAAAAAIILAVVLLREGNLVGSIAAIIGAILGGGAALVGALLVPAFGGKAAQSFAENQMNGGKNADSKDTQK